jgi:hypothetical protein
VCAALGVTENFATPPAASLAVPTVTQEPFAACWSAAVAPVSAAPLAWWATAVNVTALPAGTEVWLAASFTTGLSTVGTAAFGLVGVTVAGWDGVGRGVAVRGAVVACAAGAGAVAAGAVPVGAGLVGTGLVGTGLAGAGLAGAVVAGAGAAATGRISELSRKSAKMSAASAAVARE